MHRVYASVNSMVRRVTRATSVKNDNVIRQDMVQHRLSGVRTPRVEAVVLDWSGTTVDAFGVAPLQAFLKVFDQFGIFISHEEARRPMGLRKDLHIAAILKEDEVADRFLLKYRRKPTVADVAAIYAKFKPLQLEILNLKENNALVPGCLSLLKLQKDFQVKLGVTTGYNRAMSDLVKTHARDQGFEPESVVTSDDVQHGMGYRPAPYMLLQAARDLGVSSTHSLVKVGDTVADIHEGLNAGCWTVGVSKWSSNSNFGSMKEFQSFLKKDREECDSRLEKSRSALLQAGAHYVMDSLTDLEDVVEDINARLRDGERA